MVDWDKTMRDLSAMREYFTGCAGNASPGSDAEQKFGDYIGALVIMELEVNGRIYEEDDGK